MGGRDARRGEAGQDKQFEVCEALHRTDGSEIECSSRIHVLALGRLKSGMIRVVEQ